MSVNFVNIPTELKQNASFCLWKKEMDAEINKLLRRIHLLEDLLQRNDIPVPELDD